MAAGRPYEAPNPARPVGIAIAVVLGGVLAPLADLLARHAVIDRLQADDVLTARVGLGFLPVLVAGGIVACAEAIRRGSVGAVGGRIPDGQPTA